MIPKWRTAAADDFSMWVFFFAVTLPLPQSCRADCGRGTVARLPSVTASPACAWPGRLLRLIILPTFLKGFKLCVDNFPVQSGSPHPSEVEYVQVFFHFL